MALLITDGKQTQIRSPTEPSPFDVADAMIKRGIELHVMGIGQADPIELLRIVKVPKRLGFVRDFAFLQGQVQAQASRLCPRKFKLNYLITQCRSRKEKIGGTRFQFSILGGSC